MDYQCEDARLSADAIVKIRQKMVAKGVEYIHCQLCGEEMTPEQARKAPYGDILCRPCYINDVLDADEATVDQAIREDFPEYAKQFGV